MLTYKGKKIADRGVVVNLPHRKDRREKSDTLLKSLGFDGYEFIEGVVDTEQEWKRYGLTQTYIDCAKKAIDDNIDSLVVFEDDIKLMNGVTVNDLDKIFDKWNSFSQTYDLIAMGTRPLIDSKITKDDENFGTVSNALCTQAFLYKRNFLEYLYNTLKNYKVQGDPYYKVIIDEFINDCCSHEIIYKTKNKLFKVGITIPMLFTQHSGFSDIENSEQNYDGWIEHCFWTAIKKGEDENFK